MTTIRDVARLAGVAPITVSRVINHSHYISDETRQRVQTAIDQLGYVPNSLSQSFRWKQTGMLALMVTDITNPFWTTVARGVEDTASDAGYSLILCNTDERPEEVTRYFQALLARQIDGILLVPANNDFLPLKLPLAHQTPCVVLDRSLPEKLTDEVRCNSEQGAFLVTKYLLELGHRKIALLNGPNGISTVQERTQGYLRALKEAGINPNPQYLLHGYFTMESGFSMASRVLAMEPRPTALFAANNFITYGAMKALQENHLNIPRDISLAGFDDLPSNFLVEPFLTVAVQPAYEMGCRATELLLSRLKQKSVGQPESIILPTSLLVRQSCAAPSILINQD